MAKTFWVLKKFAICIILWYCFTPDKRGTVNYAQSDGISMSYTVDGYFKLREEG